MRETDAININFTDLSDAMRNLLILTFKCKLSFVNFNERKFDKKEISNYQLTI